MDDATRCELPGRGARIARALALVFLGAAAMPSIDTLT